MLHGKSNVNWSDPLCYQGFGPRARALKELTQVSIGSISVLWKSISDSLTGAKANAHSRISRKIPSFKNNPDRQKSADTAGT